MRAAPHPVHRHMWQPPRPPASSCRSPFPGHRFFHSDLSSTCVFLCEPNDDMVETLLVLWFVQLAKFHYFLMLMPKIDACACMSQPDACLLIPNPSHKLLVDVDENTRYAWQYLFMWSIEGAKMKALSSCLRKYLTSLMLCGWMYECGDLVQNWCCMNVQKCTGCCAKVHKFRNVYIYIDVLLFEIVIMYTFSQMCVNVQTM